MEVATKKPELMKTLTDRELIEAIQNEKNTESLNSLITIFFNRYKNYVYKGALQRTRNFANAEDLAKDITQETFKSILESRKKFMLDVDKSDQECSIIIKSWLGRIANNHFNKEYARLNNLDCIDEIISYLPELNFDQYENIDIGSELEHTNKLMVRLQEALNSIKKERDKHILLEYAREGCIQSGLHLSPNAMEYLCTLYDTTPDNIRQIKKRTLDKIKIYCFDPQNS